VVHVSFERVQCRKYISHMFIYSHHNLFPLSKGHKLLI